MSGISKRVSGSWVSGDYGIMKTSTDTITTLPAVLYPNDTTATVGISGNMEQNGTPTQDNPITPSECGDMTGNLVRFYQEEMQDNLYGVDITVKNAEITLNGTVSAGSGHWVEIGYKFGGGTELTDAVVIPCEPETTYTITIEILGGNSSEVRFIAFGTADGNKTVNIGSSLTTVFSGDINRIFISLGAEGVVFNNLKIRVMFNKGSTVLPYEPYGIKIPISSAGQTNNIYLGEVQTTRQIKKLVLTGEELWGKSGDGIYSYFGLRLGDSSTTFTTAVCTHYENVDVTKTPPAVGFMITASSRNLRIRTNDVENVTLNDFTAYLAQQYAAGTPVTVWYVLAEPTTGIDNEPLRKIGDYADTVSGITIPTIAGANSFDVLTTLKPSEVTVNYKGWHTGAVHERENGQWD